MVCYTISMRLSYSALSTFNQCPLKYKWQYVERIKVPPTQDLFFGSLVHNTLEFALKNDPVVQPIGKLIEYYQAKWNPKVFKDDISEKEYFNAGVEMLKTFHSSHTPGLTTILNIEKFFEIPWQGHVIVGKIDRIDRLPTGELEIIDYKTNKKLPGEDDFKFDLQLPLYRWAAQTLVSDSNNIKLTLYFLRHNKRLTPINLKSLDQLQKYILDSVEAIQSSKFEAKPSKLCGWCEYLFQCEAGKKYLTKKQKDGETEKPRNNGFPRDSLFSNL